MLQQTDLLIKWGPEISTWMAGVFSSYHFAEVFLHTYWNWMKGQSLVKDESEEHMNPKAGSGNNNETAFGSCSSV